HQDDVGLARDRLEDRAVRRLRFADHLDVGLGLEHAPQPRTQDGVVVDDHDADAHGAPSSRLLRAGTSATSVVPWPGVYSSVSVPRTSVTRSRIPLRPSAPSRTRAGSNPDPSSSITATAASPFSTNVMLTRSAEACLTMFVNDSCTIRYSTVSASGERRSLPRCAAMSTRVPDGSSTVA